MSKFDALMTKALHGSHLYVQDLQVDKSFDFWLIWYVLMMILRLCFVNK